MEATQHPVRCEIDLALRAQAVESSEKLDPLHLNWAAGKLCRPVEDHVTVQPAQLLAGRLFAVPIRVKADRQGPIVLDECPDLLIAHALGGVCSVVGGDLGRIVAQIIGGSHGLLIGGGSGECRSSIGPIVRIHSFRHYLAHPRIAVLDWWSGL